MKKTLFFTICFFTAITVSAQEQTDSIVGQNLQEIVVEAPRVIHKPDMDVYHPSQSTVDNSKNGLQLLSDLMIPTLSVNEALASVTSAGQPVQLRINGRPASVERIRSLSPETIKRVEWISNPGLRYNGASSVLNFIVVNPTIGGSFMAIAKPALNQAWGFYVADAKYNVGHSQWEIGSSFRLANKIGSYRDYHETFTFPDGSMLTRTETPQSGYFDNSKSDAWLTYSYVKPDTTIFMVELNLNQDLTDKFLYKGLLSLSNGAGNISLTDSHGNTGHTPGLSLYWQQQFAREQMLVVDFSSSLFWGRSFSDYVERNPVDMSILNDIHVGIKDRNQAYSLEADYIKNWNSSRLTAGASALLNRNRSTYANFGNPTFHQRQESAYLFAEYFQKLGKWSVSAGIGAQYISFRLRESKRGNNSWGLRPQATITYSPNPSHNFRLNFTSWQTAPTLVQTNIVPQQLDGFQWLIGNPDLRAATSYKLSFRYSFNSKRINASAGINASTSPDAIAPSIKWDDNKLVTTYENSRGLQNITLFFAPEIDIIPKWLSIGADFELTRERMRGTGYSHTNNSWSGNASVRLKHWGFVLSGQYMRSQSILWGEKIYWGESNNIIDLRYNWKDWQFSAGIIRPFGKYDQGSKSVNKWNTNEQHMRVNKRMPFLTISYNLQWGRQKRDTQKLISTEANAERSKAGSR